MKGTPSKVSILIPVHNAERYLERCLNSVIGQTYKNIQVVIVNDGSTDDSLTICESFAKIYPWIELYSQNNSGVAAARNALLKKASGDYLLYVDADDWIEPDMVEALVDVLESDKVDIAVCGHVSERNGQPSIALRVGEQPAIYSQKEAIEMFLYHSRLNGTLWNKMIKTSIAKGVEFDSSVSYGEDALFVWECLKKASSIGIIKSQLYHYQVNDSSISHQKFGPKKLSGHKVWRKFAEDTSKAWREFNDLAKANCAVSDFWLLVYAARDNYPKDENIRLFKRNLRSQLKSIYRLRLLSPIKMAVATCLSFNYGVSKLLLRSTRRFFNF